MTYEMNRAKVLSSLIWKLLENGGAYGIQFLFQIILARILVPSDYGILALLTVFITIANILIRTGFHTALIQKKDADEIDLSSVFYLTLAIAGILYVTMFFIAPIIADFYGEFLIINVFRALSSILVLGALSSIQIMVLTKQMQFKKQFISSLCAILVSGTIGIVIAYSGFGVWALVIQQIINQFIFTMVLWITVKWRPKRIFSFTRIKELFPYGWKLTLSSLADCLYTNLNGMIIGKIYNPALLGFYNRGEQFPQMVVTGINGSIQSVMFPVLAYEQDNKQRIKEIVKRSMITSSFIIFPTMVGLAVISEPLIKFLLTERWLMCVPYLKIFCAYYALWPIHTLNLQAIIALGRSDIFLKLEIVKKSIGIIILLISIFFGVYAIAIGTLIGGIVSTYINAYPNFKLINYGFIEQFKDYLPSLILSLIMGLSISLFDLIKISDDFILVGEVCFGVIIYLGLAHLFKLECYCYLADTLKHTIRKFIVAE